MTIAVGGAIWTPGTNSTNTATSGSITSQASGSLFVLIATCKLSTVAASPTSVSDSKGNTYSVGKQQTGAFSGVNVSIYYCFNGTGGSGHTATSNYSVNQESLQIALIEFTGLGAGSFDLSAGNDNTTTTSPFTVSSITTSVANELVINAYASFSGNGITITDSGSGFSIIVKNQTGGTQNGAASYAVPASSGTAAADTFAYGGGDYIVFAAISLKAAAAAGLGQSWQQQGQMGVMVAS